MALTPGSPLHKFTNLLHAGNIGTYLRLTTYVPTTLLLTFLFGTEGIMGTQVQSPATPHAVDRKMLSVLKRKGAQNMEDLSTLTGIGWSQVFMSVDRLSRIGKLSLTPVRPCEYRISIAGLLRR